MENKYNRECLACGGIFFTNYWNKKYCGSIDCEKIRRAVKNKKAQEKREKNPEYKEKIREKYRYNRKKNLERARIRYRERNNLVPEQFKGPRIVIKEDYPNPITHEERNSQRLDYSYIKYLFKEEGYILLSKNYNNNHSKLKVLCPENHLVDISFMSFSAGHRCSECTKYFSQSKAEREIATYLSSIDKDLIIQPNFPLFNDRQEVDIYFPAQKIAVEYCGLYWHNESQLKKRLPTYKNIRYYHRNKMDRCLDRGIRLITVFEDEYLNQPDVVLSRISRGLHVGHHVIYARKCKVRLLDKWEVSDFLNQYHLQGSSPCTVAFGLELDGHLLQVLSAGPLSRAHVGQDQAVIELKRFASIPFISVTGGFSKLFKRLIYFCRKNKITKIKSYADMRYANPFKTIYDIVGFTLERESFYTPHYVRGKKRYRNQSLRKTSTERLTNKTERELRKEQGFDIIWDCGHKSYTYTI